MSLTENRTLHELAAFCLEPVRKAETDRGSAVSQLEVGPKPACGRCRTGVPRHCWWLKHYPSVPSPG